MSRKNEGRRTTPAKPASGAAPPVLAGRYRIGRVLGTGGMGVVYRARDLLHEQFGEPCPDVAIKVLGEAFAESADAHVLLYSEFALTRSLQHERVVRAFSFEVDLPRQRAFFTMEVLPGITLDRFLRQRPGGLPWPELQPIALQLLDAVSHSHRRGVLHGDIKPSNVMVADDGVRLFDFGLGQGPAPGLARLDRGRFDAWTRAYAAPELLAGDALSARADLYGVACVLFELAHGQRYADGLCGGGSNIPAQMPRRCRAALRTALTGDPECRAISVGELRDVMAGTRQGWRGWFGQAGPFRSCT